MKRTIPNLKTEIRFSGKNNEGIVEMTKVPMLAHDWCVRPFDIQRFDATSSKNDAVRAAINCLLLFRRREEIIARN